jgi:hypothetical protein
MLTTACSEIGDGLIAVDGGGEPISTETGVCQTRTKNSASEELSLQRQNKA